MICHSSHFELDFHESSHHRTIYDCDMVTVAARHEWVLCLEMSYRLFSRNIPICIIITHTHLPNPNGNLSFCMLKCVVSTKSNPKSMICDRNKMKWIGVKISRNAYFCFFGSRIRHDVCRRKQNITKCT